MRCRLFLMKEISSQVPYLNNPLEASFKRVVYILLLASAGSFFILCTDFSGNSPKFELQNPYVCRGFSTSTLRFGKMLLSFRTPTFVGVLVQELLTRPEKFTDYRTPTFVGVLVQVNDNIFCAKCQ